MIRNVILIIFACILLPACASRNKHENIASSVLDKTTFSAEDVVEVPMEEALTADYKIDTPEVQPVVLINTDGMTLKDRFLLPSGFSRLESKNGTFAEFLQTLPVKPDGAKVKYFDGNNIS